MRIILYTGKGGVGKTSVAAATAVKLAKDGKKVLIMSTDQAHSLSDSFGVKLMNTPVKISDRLWGLEIDAILEGERAWGNMKNYIKELLTVKAEGGIEAEELLVFPGLEELFSLFKITDIYEENQYDVLIVDCAPTGETLSLLKFPEMFGNMIKTVLPMKKKAVKVAGPMIEKVMKIPMPEDNVFDDVEQLYEKLYQLQELMTNKEILTIRIVTTPERIVIKEAKRNFTYLHLYNYNIDAVIVNKVYPPKALDGYFSKWINLQEEGLKEIRESFSEVPVFTLMLLDKELATEAILLEAAEQIFGETDPAAVLFKDTIFEVRKEDDGYAFILNIPFAEKTDLDMGQKGSELMIQIKNEKRCFTLPDILRNKTVQSAKYEAGKLLIKFA
ncbi:ArsA family ATPase [uncultured Acetobacterium sp.]|uniref:ArsA family ATPase n=1 Tax=uncultured Acetobacterium sp. TaxID=217139 RepID=UPI0025D9EBD4|nr:ArsA family ATPase [uncultured Acetobacterium sp.]